MHTQTVMPKTKNSAYLFAAMLFFGIAACSGERAPAAAEAGMPAVKLKLNSSKESLMQAVFGDKYSATRKHALAAMPQFQQRGKTSTFVITPLATSLLPSGETALITESHIPLAPGQMEPNFNDVSGLVNVYILKPAHGQWQVIRRHESLVYRGYGNRPGSIIFPMLGADRQGLAVMHASQDEGCSSETLHLYDLGHQQLQNLANIPTGHAENAGCGGDENFEEVFTDTTWQLVAPKGQASMYKDIVLTMTSQKIPYQAEEGEEARAAAVKEKITVRYAFDGTRYKIAEGSNPLDHDAGE